MLIYLFIIDKFYNNDLSKRYKFYTYLGNLDFKSGMATYKINSSINYTNVIVTRNTTTTNNDDYITGCCIVNNLVTMFIANYKSANLSIRILAWT